MSTLSTLVLFTLVIIGASASASANGQLVNETFPNQGYRDQSPCDESLVTLILSLVYVLYLGAFFVVPMCMVMHS